MSGEKKSKKLVRDLDYILSEGLPHEKGEELINDYVDEALESTPRVSVVMKAGFIAGIGEMLTYLSERTAKGEKGLWNSLEALTLFLWQRHLEKSPERKEIADEYSKYKQYFWNSLMYWTENTIR
ncbi:hypothetical protein [Clostridium tyrobutyricum]|uniref:hypothetical protein n=1 Tax=Clostridium tyrobutyricum TaxID=1519 RepID=UPI001C37E936|nr:hypothetical protein [Clostridium tyrobutyricum]MBV4429082.1 hypothetical protein [Clostridium tyrobutyricum]MBV4444159.1 hypothetical protein [Clostridium tyrobutyricum]